MTEKDTMALGDFSEQADAYRRARPTYPSELLDALCADARIVAGDPVVDFGAGTGIMTRLLIERKFDVTAVEPNESMQVLAPDQEQARWVTSTFEESRLNNESQRWAIAAQAFHWADPQRSLPEIRRILQPGCLLTILWNNRANQENDVLDWTEKTIQRHVPEFDEAYRNRPWDQILESTGDFALMGFRSVRHTVPMNQERYLDLWKSHNRLNNIAGPVRFVTFFNELEDYLQRNQIDQIDVPYDCIAWSARRRD